MFPLNLENQRQSRALRSADGFHSTPISVFVSEKRFDMYCVPPTSDRVCCIRVLPCVLGNVVLRVGSCNRDSENDMDPRMSYHKFIFFNLFLIAWETLRAIYLCLSVQ